jgi:hypothetical protein
MIRWFPGSSQRARSPSTVYQPGLEGDASDAISRARSERLSLDAKNAATLRHKLALMDITVQHIAGHRSHLNPDQPRVPAGNPDGGQWTSVGGATGSRLAAADKPRLGPHSAIAILVEVAKRLIEAYRSENGLWDLFGQKKGVVAFTTIDGRDVFGANSDSPAYTSADKAAAIRMRDILVEKYPNNFPAEHVGRIPNNAFFHAETTVLLRAAQEKGGTLANQTLTVHVDGQLCNRCKAVLPYVGLELGNPTVTFVDPNGSTNTMRDGAWLSSK